MTIFIIALEVLVSIYTERGWMFFTISSLYTMLSLLAPYLPNGVNLLYLILSVFPKNVKLLLLYF